VPVLPQQRESPPRINRGGRGGWPAVGRGRRGASGGSRGVSCCGSGARSSGADPALGLLSS